MVDQLCEKISIGLAFIVVCGICMVITGFCVYTGYGWNGPGSQGPNATFFTKLGGIIDYLGSKTIDQDEATKSTENKCPEYGPCPSVFQECWGGGCLAQEPKCKSTPPPVPRKCENPPKCPLGQYPEHPPCVPPRPPVRAEFTSAIDLFRTVLDRRSFPMWRWMQMFQPMSSERLEVITTLMDDDLERWNLASFAIRCPGIGAVERKDEPEKYCSYCGKSRYDYILCAMKNNLTGPGYPEKPYYGGEITLLEDQKERIMEMERNLFAGNKDSNGIITQVFSLITDWDPVDRTLNPAAFWAFDDATVQMRKKRYNYALMVKGYNSSAGDIKEEWSCQVCNEHAMEKEGLAYVDCFANRDGTNKKLYEDFVKELS